MFGRLDGRGGLVGKSRLGSASLEGLLVMVSRVVGMDFSFLAQLEATKLGSHRRAIWQ